MSRTKQAARRGRGKPSLQTLDSRSAIIAGKKRKAPPSKARSASKPSNKRRKRNDKVGERETIDFVPSGGDFSAVPAIQNPPTSTAPLTHMATEDLGTNRLRSGFRQLPRARPRSGTPPDTDEDVSDPSIISVGVDDEDEEDEESEDGGIILNVQETLDANRAQTDVTEAILISDEEEGQRRAQTGDKDEEYESSAEEGETHTQSEAGPPTPTDVGQSSFVIDPRPSKAHPALRLSQLSPDDLEDQLRYAYYNLPRNEIDLNRFVRCLSCLAEGHLSTTCPANTCRHCIRSHPSHKCPKFQRCSRCRGIGHDSKACNDMKNTTVPCDICHRLGHIESDCSLRHYRYSSLKPDDSEQLNLWISCAACASRSHLVGDCPDLTTSSQHKARWSLSTVDPRTVTNLLIQTDARIREKEAAARGLRPPGSISLRGRGNRPPPGYNKTDLPSDSDDSLDNFLHHPPPILGQRLAGRAPQTSSYRPYNGAQYDRFDAPSGRDGYRPPRNDFYSTDSFGRSRSPPRIDERGFRRRSPSPRGSDHYRPNINNRATSPRSRSHHSPTRSGAGLPPKPSGNKGISIALPTRNGAKNTPSSRSAPTALKARRDRKAEARQHNSGAMMGNHKITK